MDRSEWRVAPVGTVGGTDRMGDRRERAEVDEQTRGSVLRPWAWAALVLLAVIGGLWVWADVTPQAGSGNVEASGRQAAAIRDDGLTWRVAEFRPGSRAEVRVDIARRGPVPVSVRGVPDIDAGPPVATYCGWWPDRLFLDGEELTTRSTPIPLPRTGTSELVLSGAFLGDPGCMDDERIGARRRVRLELAVAGGGPKTVQIALPEVLAWSPVPRPAADRLADRSVRPRVGTAP